MQYFEQSVSPFLISFITSFTAAAMLLFLAGIVSAGEHRLFFGTYTRGNTGSKGIYTCKFDSEMNKFTEPVLAGESEDPTFLAIHPDKNFLYATGSKEQGKFGRLYSFRYDKETGKLTALNSKDIPGSSSCHLALCISEDKQNEAIAVANYSSSSVVSFPVLTDGSLGKLKSDIHHTGTSAHPSRQKEPHPHGTYFNLLGKNTVAVPDLGTDRVYFYDFDLKTAKLTPNKDIAALAIPSGGGSRHLAASEKFIYVTNELDLTVCVFDRVQGQKNSGKETLAPIQQVSTLLPNTPHKPNYSTSEIELSKDGRFLYVSNRGHESIAVFSVNKESGKITLIQVVPCGGVHPRYFCIDPTGKFLLCCNKDTNNTAVFSIDSGTGKLTQTETAVAVPAPVCIVWVP
ncbi:6-phosphogluconolactonase [Planctomycetales bacterium]|nr:6-phosphogluconolactonase [Planctomycetales bacterium]GHT36881.1 6-phosphogluconolactonase [Planctomycetales bacterium]